MNPYSLSVCALLVLWLSCFQVQAGGVPDGYRIGSGFTENGQELTLAPKQKEGVLFSQQPLAPGWYALRGEYKTTGIAPEGMFAADAKTADWKTALSEYEWNPSASEWVPFQLLFRVESAGPCLLRIGNWRKAQSDAQIELRGLQVAPFTVQGGVNWLINGDWSAGAVGECPPPWTWKSQELTAAQYCLASNTSFKTGRQVLQLSGEEKRVPILVSHFLPLPQKGEVVFSVWAKTAAPDAKLIMHVVAQGWSPRVEGGGQVTSAWRKLEARLPVPSDGKKKSFFVRLDPHLNGMMELADAQVVWYPDGKPEEAGQPLTQSGWPGVPGANLLLNPDLELGGNGYYYDFTWPKKFSDFAGNASTRPISFLTEKGVDGGTCAFVKDSILRSWCFPVTTGKTYTISVDLRAPDGLAETEASVMAFDPEWNAALWTKAEKIPGDHWKRYFWTVKWSENNIQKRGYVRVNSGTGVLVDRLQVVEGTQTDYQAPPVMLGLLAEKWPYFVRGRDAAKMTIRVVPGMKTSGTTAVEVVARDVWKKVVWRKEITAPLDVVTNLPVELPADRLGVFHVELNARIAGKLAGIGVSRYAILDRPNLQPAVTGKPGLFGVCGEIFNYPLWLNEEHARIQTDLGIRFNRFFACVPADQPDPLPTSYTADLLARCKAYRDAGIELMPCLNIFPPRAGEIAQSLNMPQPADLQEYGRQLKNYVAALQTQARYWEICNEPNLWRVASGPDRGKPTMWPEKYLAFQKTAHEAIKSLDPELQVVCNALNNLPAEWLDRWLAAGGGDFMDSFSFHPYAWIDVYPGREQLREQFAKYKINKPVINSEKYFGCNLFYDRAGYEETRRGYYLPHEEELRVAGWSLQHTISLAAGGIPYCAFAPFATLYTNMPGDTLFLYDYFGALNAATRFLATAGEGERLDLGASLSAYLFPSAPEGPLVALWTPLDRAEATMSPLPGGYTAFDLMGNPYSDDESRRGIRVANDPVYLRFSPGTTPQSIRTALQNAQVTGLGDPLRLELAFTGQGQLLAAVTSYRNRPLSGSVKLLKLPEGWKAATDTATFRDLAPGRRAALAFACAMPEVKNLGSYPVSALAEAGDEFVRCEKTLRPVFAGQRPAIKPDGNLSDWTANGWIMLGGAQTSCDFTPGLRRTNDADLSARVACGWTADSFRLAVEVTDNTDCPPEAERRLWDGDSLQLYFDPLRDSGKESGLADDVIYTIARINGTPVAWIEKGAQGNFKGAANKEEGLADADVQLAIRRTGDKTEYEMIFPRTSCLPAALLQAGGGMRFSLLINDNDGKGRKTGLTFAPCGKEPFGAPEDYCDLIFLPE